MALKLKVGIRMMLHILATALPLNVYTLPAKEWKKARDSPPEPATPNLSCVKQSAVVVTTVKKLVESGSKHPSSGSQVPSLPSASSTKGSPSSVKKIAPK